MPNKFNKGDRVKGPLSEGIVFSKTKRMFGVEWDYGGRNYYRDDDPGIRKLNLNQDPFDKLWWSTFLHMWTELADHIKLLHLIKGLNLQGLDDETLIRNERFGLVTRILESVAGLKEMAHRNNQGATLFYEQVRDLRKEIVQLKLYGAKIIV